MTTGQLVEQPTKTIATTRILPARIVLDIDPQTGQEFSYEWKSDREYPDGRWLNLTTENYHSDEFIRALELDVLHVHFGNSLTLTGPQWREIASPRFLRVNGNAKF